MSRLSDGGCAVAFLSTYVACAGVVCHDYCRDVVEVQTKKTLAANSALVSAASAVLEEQLLSANRQQATLQVPRPYPVPVSFAHCPAVPGGCTVV